MKLICAYGEEGIGDEYDYYGVEKRFDIVKLSYPKGRLGGLCYGLGIRKLFKSQNCFPDIFYARNIYGLVFIASFGIPFIYEAHNAPGKMRCFLEKWLFLRANFKRLVVISDALKRRYLELFSFLDGKRVSVAHDAADLPLNCGTKIACLLDAKVNIGYFGSLNVGRGRRIISELARRFPSIMFHIIGGRPNEVEDWKAKLYDCSNVFFYGFMPHPEAEKYRLAMDILIAPYQDTVKTRQWMSPLKIFEYMAAGKAIICSDFPVLREVLVDGFNAMLVRPNDVEEWHQAVNRLLGDPTLRERLGTNARGALKKHYTWSERAAKVLNGYDL